MKKSLFVVITVSLLVAIAVSCVNDGGIIEGDVDARAKKTLTVLGYGFEKGANSSGTEMAARQFAIASLGEQVKGSQFDFTVQGNRVDFSMQSDAVIPGMREYYKHTERASGKYYATYIMGAEIEIEYPKPYGVFVKSYTDTGESISTIVNAMKVSAVKECAVDKFTGKMPSRLKGRLFVTGLDVTPESNGTSVRVSGTISVVFDSVSR